MGSGCSVWLGGLAGVRLWGRAGSMGSWGVELTCLAVGSGCGVGLWDLAVESCYGIWLWSRAVGSGFCCCSSNFTLRLARCHELIINSIHLVTNHSVPQRNGTVL